MIVAASPQLHLLVVRLTSEAKERQSQSTLPAFPYFVCAFHLASIDRLYNWNSCEFQKAGTKSMNGFMDLSEVDIPAGVFLHPAVGWG